MIASEVERAKNIFGEHFIVFPSHEALLANVSYENAMAMRNPIGIFHI